MKLQSLQVLVENLIEAGFLVETRPIISRVSGKINSIEVGNTSLINGDFSFEENSVLHYLESIRQNRISWLLFDGSIVQISYSLKKDNILAHRYCYIPAPYDLDLRSSSYDNVFEIIEAASLASPLERSRRTMLRFEYDPDAQKDHHPSSHLHLNSPNCRLPMRGPLAVNEFAHFLIRFFYLNQFTISVCGEVNFASPLTITEVESGNFHISWRHRVA